VRVDLMIEGQEDVTWDDWRALAGACEEHGIETLFRSDHYLSVFGKGERGSLDAWATINALAATTSKVRLGTLVSPVTFRHAAELAKVVVTADHVSGGRVELGLGTGWLEPEHETYGFPFPPLGERMALLEQQLKVINSHWTEGPQQPKPVQRPRPNLIVGGRGGPRSIRMAARYADEYNTVNKTAAECAGIHEQLDEACEAAGRDPIPLSLMVTWLAGEDRAELLDRAGRLAEWQRHEGDGEHLLGELRDSAIAGTLDENVERLRELAAAGVERVMLQHLLHRDLDAVAQIGRVVAPAVARARSDV
jgi:alkanesulfonate monooxygenase SsuD/methylene tetrahydromethanopterin reductase-like flavin-dependent oxidoreductase (luciferase family)